MAGYCTPGPPRCFSYPRPLLPTAFFSLLSKDLPLNPRQRGGTTTGGHAPVPRPATVHSRLRPDSTRQPPRPTCSRVLRPDRGGIGRPDANVGGRGGGVCCHALVVLPRSSVSTVTIGDIDTVMLASCSYSGADVKLLATPIREQQQAGCEPWLRL